MTHQDPEGPMTGPRTTADELKDAPIPTAANPGGASQTADESGGIRDDASDAALTNGGAPVPTGNQEAG